MEFQTTNRRIGTIETIFDDFDERPVDCDFMLPDYLPDIAAVLKCMMKPQVQSHQLSGDRVLADGTVVLQVLYLDETRHCVHTFEVSQPFTSAFTVKNLNSSDCITLTTKVNYVNCRATSPRRVDIHGAFSVKLTVTSEGGVEVLGSAEGAHLQTRSRTLCYSVPTSCAEKSFTLTEVLELENGQAAETILRTEPVAVISECKQMTGKAVVKGELHLKTVYTVDGTAGTLGMAHYQIPFSQIIDAQGLGEETLCDCKVHPTLCEVHLTQNPNGENRLLSVTAKLVICLCAYRTDSCEVVTDAYHTDYPVKCQSRRVEGCQITGIHTDTCTVSQSLSLPDADVKDIVDCWCDVSVADCHAENGSHCVDGRLLICMLTRDATGTLSYYERPAEFTLPFAEPCDRMTATVKLLDTAYTMNGNQLELRLQLCAERICMNHENLLAISALSADESENFVKADAMSNCCMKVYFASQGDSVWDIAKAQHTSLQALQQENDLTEDALSHDQMLVIPLR